MKIVRTEDGCWILQASDGTLLGTFNTNAEAWRALDRITGDAISKAEERTDAFTRELLTSGGRL